MSEKSKQEIDKQALDESIVKWEAIVGEYEKGNEIIMGNWRKKTKSSIGLGWIDCPLCELYWDSACSGCPLRINNGRCNHLNTRNIWGKYNKKRDLATATAMLNKLKELRRAYD